MTEQRDDPTDGGDAGLFDRLRASLADGRAQIEHQVSSIEADERAVLEEEGFADTGQVTAEQDEARSLAAELRDQLDGIDRALERLDAGTYGVCEVCGDPIGDERLEAMPSTPFCREHAA